MQAPVLHGAEVPRVLQDWPWGGDRSPRHSSRDAVLPVDGGRFHPKEISGDWGQTKVSSVTPWGH